MTLKQHIMYSLAPSTLLWAAAGPLAGAGFLVGAVLIDLDHPIEYWAKSRDLNPRNMFCFYIRIADEFLNEYYKGLAIFHTIEFLLLLMVLAYFFQVFTFILAGVIFHHLLDAWHLSKLRCFNKRSYSLLGHIWHTLIRPDKRRGPMLAKEAQIIESIRNGKNGCS